MHVVVTGGAGFLGSRLARELLAAGSLAVAGGAPRALSRLTLLDRVPVPPDLVADSRVAVGLGDLADPGFAQDALAGAELIFHLAAAVSGECEADFDLGLRANLQATQALLASCRALGTSPVVVFTSSLAVFGGSAETVITDDTWPVPQTSYGTQKVMCEYLLADYTRKGFLNGRAVRLMTVSVRPGRPNAAASGFLSGIVREPLAGQRTAGQRVDRLGPRPHDFPDVRHLARPDPGRPRRPAGPDPRPRLRLRDQDAPRRIMTDPVLDVEAILGLPSVI
jgi:nucleoside-diphosphate-sugar epimerase